MFSVLHDGLFFVIFLVDFDLVLSRPNLVGGALVPIRTKFANLSK